MSVFITWYQKQKNVTSLKEFSHDLTSYGMTPTPKRPPMWFWGLTERLKGCLLGLGIQFWWSMAVFSSKTFLVSSVPTNGGAPHSCPCALALPKGKMQQCCHCFCCTFGSQDPSSSLEGLNCTPRMLLLLPFSMFHILINLYPPILYLVMSTALSSYFAPIQVQRPLNKGKHRPVLMIDDK